VKRLLLDWISLVMSTYQYAISCRPQTGPYGVTKVASLVKFAATAAASFLASASVNALKREITRSRNLDQACLFVGRERAKQS